MRLQRTIGNRHVARLFAPPPVVRRSVMRGDPPSVKLEPGGVAPTSAKFLVGRFEAILDDAGLQPATVTTLALSNFKVAVQPTVQAHPLAPPSARDLAVEAIYGMPPSAAGLTYNDFKQGCTGALLSKFIVANRAGEISEHGAAAEIDALLDPHAAAAEVTLYTDQAVVKNASLNAAVQATVGHNPLHRDSINVAAERHLATEHRGALREPAGDDKNRLIAALETMPTVKKMYAGTLGKGGDGKLLKELDVLPGAQQQAHFKEYCVRFVDEATKGLSQYADLVEPGRRPPDDRATRIQVNPDEVEQRFLQSPKIKSFRADSAREMDRVRLSIMDEAPTVVHEVGHQVEFALPIAEWLDLLQILQMRAGGGRMVDIYGTGKEIAFAAAMPAFRRIYGDRPSAKYGAKVYESGDTEMTSMAMEMFSQPAKAKIMIHEDPLLSATVLRNIRPLEFRLCVPAELQALLPRGAV